MLKLNNFTSRVLSLGCVLFAGAAAALAGTTTLAFEGGTGGTVEFSSNTCTSNCTVSTFTSVPVNELVVSGSTMKMYTITNGAFNYNTANPYTLTLTGDISGLSGLSTGTNTLETIKLGAPLTASSVVVGGSFDISVSSLPSVTGSVTTNSLLLSDLGLSQTAFKSLTDSGVVKTGDVYQSTSADFTLTASQSSAPEPVSILLVSGGLIGFGAFRWRKARISRS